MVGMALAHLVPGLVLLGFAFLVLTRANKESGNLKLFGQIIGWGLVVVVLLFALRCGLKKSCPICPKSGATTCAMPAVPEAPAAK